jgi:hypothetical protein
LGAGGEQVGISKVRSGESFQAWEQKYDGIHFCWKQTLGDWCGSWRGMRLDGSQDQSTPVRSGAVCLRILDLLAD